MGVKNMAIFVKVSNPIGLLNDMKSSIANGEIDNWVCDIDGDFTLADEKFQNEAWFHPYLPIDEMLVFGIIGRKNVSLPMSLFSIFHSELVKTLLNKYCGQVDDISVVPPFSNHFDTKKIEERKEYER